MIDQQYDNFQLFTPADVSFRRIWVKSEVSSSV